MPAGNTICKHISAGERLSVEAYKIHLVTRRVVVRVDLRRPHEPLAVVAALAKALPSLVDVAGTAKYDFSIQVGEKMGPNRPRLDHVAEEIILVHLDQVVIEGDGARIRRVRRGRVADLDIKRVRLWITSTEAASAICGMLVPSARRPWLTSYPSTQGCRANV
jgi:hypothetical protein